MEKHLSFNIHELKHRQLASGSGEIFSKSLVLTDLLKFKDLFVHHEILSPGKRVSSPHTHTAREEMVFVLTGFPTACVGDKRVPLKPGDFIGFLPNSLEPHCIENLSTEEVRFLVIGSNPVDDQILYFEKK